MNRQAPQICESDIAEAWNLLHGDLTFVWKAPHGGGIASARPSSLGRALQLCHRMADWNAYISLNPHTLDGKPTIDSVRRADWLMLDFDPRDGAETSDWTFPYDNLTGLLAQFGVSFHYDVPVIQSGRGIQMWVPVAQNGLTVREAHQAFKVIGKHVSALFEGNTHWHFDTTCCDVSRIVRCPGTINHKTKRLASIATPPTGIQPPRRIDLSGIELPAEPARLEPLADARWFMLAPKLHQFNLAFLLNGVSKSTESRHGRLFNCAKDLWNLGIDAAKATELLTAGSHRCRPSLLNDDPMAVEKVVRQLWTTPFVDFT